MEDNKGYKCIKRENTKKNIKKLNYCTIMHTQFSITQKTKHEQQN
jgi:hypothetical protein